MNLFMIYPMLKNSKTTVYFQDETEQYLIDDTDYNFNIFLNARYIVLKIESFNDKDLLVTVSRY